MNSLFEERAKALRRFILELLTLKQNQLMLLSEEIEPQKELLRQKRAKLLLTQEEFQSALEKLTQE